MRFIDGEQGYWKLPQSLQETFTHQSFRGNIEQVELSVVQLCQNLTGLGTA